MKRQQEFAVGRGIMSGKFGEFLFKVLKAKIDFDPGCVFAE
jgi:hypothetical protein